MTGTHSQRGLRLRWAVFAIALWCGAATHGQVIFQRTSAYHNIRVYDRGGLRILSFNGSQETRMSLRNHLQGHFAYTEFFHLPWIWNNQITNVLMMGLGGGSTQRSFQYYYPQVHIDTVEIDPLVVDVAKRYFNLKTGPNHRIHVSDGRVYLRRHPDKHDLIIMDAYSSNRYGSFIPYHLVSKEFFELASSRLTDQGVLAYNVIGTIRGWQADIFGAVYNTLVEVFPQVYYFPAPDSKNVVIIATKSLARYPPDKVREETLELVRSRKVRLPTFIQRVRAFHIAPPASSPNSPVLSDDYAPVDGLLTRTR